MARQPTDAPGPRQAMSMAWLSSGGAPFYLAIARSVSLCSDESATRCKVRYSANGRQPEFEGGIGQNVAISRVHRRLILCRQVCAQRAHVLQQIGADVDKNRSAAAYSNCRRPTANLHSRDVSCSRRACGDIALLPQKSLRRHRCSRRNKLSVRPPTPVRKERHTSVDLRRQ
jgi:hypothetical protein